MTQSLSEIQSPPLAVGAHSTPALGFADQRTAVALERAIRARRRVPALPTAPVGSFRVSDATRTQVVESLAGAYRNQQGYVAFALHVGGLLHRRDELYLAAMASADLVYADGVSIVRLATQAGARQIERAATTDIGEDLLAAVSADPGRRPRVALIGGPPGLAVRAGDALRNRYAIDVVQAEHGFHDDWQGPLTDLLEADPDIVVVGLGAPREMHWVHRNRAVLGDRVVLTCGGWFGFLAGEESRAPQLVQRLSCEWVWRWAQQPQRLARRYVLGAVVCLQISLGLRLARVRTRFSARGTVTP